MSNTDPEAARRLAEIDAADRAARAEADAAAQRAFEAEAKRLTEGNNR